MNMKLYDKIFLLVVSVLCFQCKKDATISTFSDNGYVSYQYMDTSVSNVGDTTIIKAFNTFQLTKADFMLDTTVPLPDSLNTIFRRVNLQLYSSANSNSKTNKMVGSSLISISLIDSIINTIGSPSGLTPFIYTNATDSAFFANKKKTPIWESLTGNLNLQLDTVTQQLVYRTTFYGQKGITINLIYIGNNRYQLIAYGSFNNLSFNIYYTGQIKMRSD